VEEKVTSMYKISCLQPNEEEFKEKIKEILDL
jgi:hypothetical protein